ncbi:MAG: hypothetical protein E7509_00100 [Ruminococcus sp.]|nr:hypothetical protein [Ruminococcus sp.]
MVDSCSYLFSIESTGSASSKGFFISISGDAVDDGTAKFDSIELHRLKGIKFEVTKYGLKKLEKKEGGFTYQLSLRNFDIPEKGNCGFLGLFKKDDSLSDMNRIEKEIQFKLNVSYSGDKESDVLIGVFPYENVISGAASKWVTISPDKDYFKKIYEGK